MIFFLPESPSEHDHVIGQELRPKTQLRLKVRRKPEKEKRFEIAGLESYVRSTGAPTISPTEAWGLIRGVSEMGDPASPSSEMQPLRSNKARIRKRPERLANWLATQDRHIK